MITRHKYGAKPQREGGRYYASTAERDYHRELLLREVAQDVRSIIVQPVVELVANIRYRPDYRFQEKTSRGAWRTVYVDVKGVETAEFRLKVKLWRDFGPAPLQIVKRSGRRRPFVVVREIVPKPKRRNVA